MLIQVTEEDVARSRPLAPDNSPIGHAIERALPGYHPMVAAEWVWLGPWHKRRAIHLPADVVAALRAYDQTGKMQPMTFELVLGAAPVRQPS